VTAALAVAAVVVGWAAGQAPRLLPGLTVVQAAAGRSTLIALIVAVVGGAVVLVPSLGLLFTLYLRGRLDTAEKSAPQARTRVRPAAGLGSEPASPGTRVRVRGGAAVAGVVVGTGMLVFADAGWAHLVGVACLVVCAVAVFLLAAPGEAELRSGSSPLSHIVPNCGKDLGNKACYGHANLPPGKRFPRSL
jgi:cytochrome d ubiquinol oxidase subunit II